MTGREAAAEALGPFLRDFAQKAIDAAPTAVALTATGLAATALPDLLAAIERGDIPGVGVLPESETLTEAERTFIGSSALLTALYETVLAHPHMFEPDGPDGPYVWCVDGWRSDDHGGPGGAATAWAVHLSNALHAEAVKALQPLVERKGAQPASVDAGTLRQVADELADWTFPDPDETQPHSAYRVALLERLYRYVGLLRSRADLPDREPDGSWVCGRCGGSPKSHAAVTSECVYDPIFRREPDGLRAQVEVELNSEDAHAVLYGVTGTHPDSYGGVSKDEALECAVELLTRLRALLAHPATDQEEADRG